VSQSRKDQEERSAGGKVLKNREVALLDRIARERENTRTVRTERSVGEAATKKIEDLRRNSSGVCLFAKHQEKRERPPRFIQHCQLASPHPPHGPRHSRLHDSLSLSFPSSSIASPVPHSLNSIYTSFSQSTKDISFVTFVLIAIFS
jgi:hypothetical protein